MPETYIPVFNGGDFYVYKWNKHYEYYEQHADFGDNAGALGDFMRMVGSDFDA